MRNPKPSDGFVKPLDLGRLTVLPLERRNSLSRVEDIAIDPDSAPAGVGVGLSDAIAECSKRVRDARERGSSVILIYGAHLLRNGAAALIDRLMGDGWVTHLATNGAGAIHDWEFAWLGRSTECVKSNVASGTFGAWDETGRYTHIALLAGGLEGMGYGESLGRFIETGGAELPRPDSLREQLAAEPDAPSSPARAELLRAMIDHGLPGGRIALEHPWKSLSVTARAFARGIPFTVHPGIGYDIVSCHPMFNGGVLGRAAGIDFRKFAGAVDHLDGGVALSIGSAIMGPQVFEKSLSCVNNIRLGAGHEIVRGHSLYVVDIQEGEWDWSRGEPPKEHPAYYLRFCKSYSRMGGDMKYLQVDNAAFIHHLYSNLSRD